MNNNSENNRNNNFRDNRNSQHGSFGSSRNFAQRQEKIYRDDDDNQISSNYNYRHKPSYLFLFKKLTVRFQYKTSNHNLFYYYLYCLIIEGIVIEDQKDPGIIRDRMRENIGMMIIIIKIIIIIGNNPNKYIYDICYITIHSLTSS